jgi:acyl-CoA synthetase (AMP-forming)/AMP-acid ligase II
MAPLGFDETALCPAYGMAEASLAVTMVRPARRWRSTAGDGDGPETVSCGVPLRCLEVRAPAGGEAGPIAVRGASMLTGYLGQAASPLDGDGWFATSDLGYLSGGELHVAGRADDVLVVAGRKLTPEPLEEVASRHEALRPGNCAAIPDGAGGYVIVAERRRARARADRQEVCRWIRRELALRAGVAPTAVVIVSPGSIPRTPSGKLQRRRLAALRGAAELAVEEELRFGAPAIPPPSRGTRPPQRPEGGR